MARKPTEYVQFKLRIRESLRRRIELEALKKAHSANAEAVERIVRTFRDEEIARDGWIELRAREKQFIEESSRWRQHEMSTERDAMLLHNLIGQGDGPRLLSRILMKLGQNLDWAKSASGRQQLADEILPLILDPNKTVEDGHDERPH